MRTALYFTPPDDDPLTRAAVAWLGRDAWRPAAPSGEAGPDSIVREPRRYGFHATLKPPFRLAEGKSIEALRGALAAFAAVRPPVTIASLELARIGAFFALVPGGDAAGLDALAGGVVTEFEAFRAPPSASEIARRDPERLTPRQRAHLEAWGYPYVFDEFRFHMTLTGRVPAEQQNAVEAVLRARFAPFIGRPLVVDTLCLFVERDPPGDFVVDTAVRLAGAAA